ncbi:hypothetical protein CAMRE0001_2676 [Campylobacter rectus RM3267]|uniref:Uncharacterized protein n=1 Tax=Campylobacter rectus RM3267 TaxID=553218 RepID=B9D3Y3_CAMRE|nr:hypothetical protein CAMRE0001_2676 [Campylobacter rectus RM3267]
MYQIEANKYIVFIGLVFVLLALKNYCDVMGINIFEIFIFFIFYRAYFADYFSF